MTTTMFSGMSLLVLFIVKATLVLLAALCAASVLRRSTAGARHLVWLAALVGVLALPVLARIPTLRLTVLPATIGDARLATSDAREAAPSPSAVTPVAHVAAPVAENDGPVAQSPSLRVAESPTTTLLVAWAGIALSLLAWLVIGAIRVRRIVDNGRELSSPDWMTPLCEVADRLDLDVPPRVVISDEIEMAFAARATTPTIVLPKTAESWNDDRRRAVLFHELAHIKRHDLIGHTLGRIACALYWFHPLVWTAARQLRAESERACDDLVLTCGARPSEYAQHLLDMVTSVRKHGAPIMALPMARKKEFEGRMLAILDPAVRRAAPGRVQAATVVATLGALSLTIAAAAPARAPSTRDRGIVTSAKGEGRPSLPSTAPSGRPAFGSPAVSVTPRDKLAKPDTGSMVDIPNQQQLTSVVTKFATQMSTVATNAVVSVFSGKAKQGTDTARSALLVRVLETDADISVRRSAAWALHDMPSAAARGALVKAVRGDADASVREMAAWSLSDFESDDAASALADALLKDKDERVRATSAWALAEFDQLTAMDALMSSANDPDANVRETAIWAIGQHAPHHAPASVANALTDASPRVRTVAAWTLGQTADTSVVHAIARAFETETDNHVRTAELWALSNIGQAPTSVVEAAMKSSDPEIRRHGVAMLAGPNLWPWPWPRPQPRPSP